MIFRRRGPKRPRDRHDWIDTYPAGGTFVSLRSVTSEGVVAYEVTVTDHDWLATVVVHGPTMDDAKALAAELLRCARTVRAAHEAGS